MQTLEISRLLDRRHVLRLFDYANEPPVARRVSAVIAGVDVGDVAAGGTVGDAILHLAHCVAQPIDFFARGFHDMKREPLRSFRSDTRESLKLFDELP